MIYNTVFKNRIVRNGNPRDKEISSIELSQWGWIEAQFILKKSLT